MCSVSSRPLAAPATGGPHVCALSLIGVHVMTGGGPLTWLMHAGACWVAATDTGRVLQPKAVRATCTQPISSRTLARSDRKQSNGR